MDAMRRFVQPVLSRPFLRPIFAPTAEPSISAGFHYSPAEAALLGRLHQAVDIAVPRGEEVRAPHDGWYMATYGEKVLLDASGRHKQVSPEEAYKLHPADGLVKPTNGDYTGYFGSLMVQGYLGRGLYLQLAHLDWVEPIIPFHTQQMAAFGSNQIHSWKLRVPPKDMPKHAVWLEKGSLIGYSGMSGCGWGKRHFYQAPSAEDGRPDFRGVPYAHYDVPHVHFGLFWWRRWPEGNATVFLDPFGAYSADTSKYPTNLEDWSEMPGSLWLPQI